MSATKLPSIKERSFVCPHCEAVAAQSWFWTVGVPETGAPGSAPDGARLGNYCQGTGHQVSGLHIANCHNCHQISVWIGGEMVYPSSRGLAVKPNPDLSEDVQKDFEEARQIALVSPRGAAALLRLAVQKLCKELGEEGKNIDKDIASLVKKGLDPLVQMALDAVRVIGNEQVHPGELDLRDDLETAVYLFDLVNTIADQLITRPKAVRAVYEKLPQAKRDAIDKRNAAALSKNDPPPV